MSSLQFNEAPAEADDRGSNEPDKTTDETTASTAKGKGPRMPRPRWYDYSPPLAQGMAVTPGTQDSDMGLAPEANDKNKGSTVGRDSGGTGTPNEEDEDDIVYSSDEEEENEGPFQKVCSGISSEVEEDKAARAAMKIYTEVFEGDLEPDMRIQVCSEQLAPFPLLAVTAENRIVVLHGIRRLIVPLTHNHKLQTQTLAFINEEQKETGFPIVVKLMKEDFETVERWSHPDTQEIMNIVVRNKKVLPLPEVSDTVKTTKFIPIPLFLVPMFLERKRGLSAVEAFQAFYDYFEKASSDVRQSTEFIYNFLLAAAGFDSNSMFNNVPVSQLAVSMDEVGLDSIITHWASSQFGGIKHIAGIQEATENFAASQDELSMHYEQEENTAGTMGGAHNATAGISSTTRGAPNATVGTTSATGGASNATAGIASTTGGAPNATVGTTSTTGGAPIATAGIPSTNGGAHNANAGTTSTTGGVSNATAGIPSTNGGAHNANAGTTSTTGGVSNANAGIPSTNGGANNATGGVSNTTISRTGGNQGITTGRIAGGPRNANQRRPTYRPLVAAAAGPQGIISNRRAGQIQAQRGSANQGILGQEAKIYIAETMRSALDGFMQSSIIPRLNNVQTTVVSSSSKSAKMLNGTGKYNALAYSGMTVQDEVSDMLKMLDSNEHETIKFNTLLSKLNALQIQFPFMNFTLRMETMRDLMKHKFESKPSIKNMMKGFTPFILQKMEEEDEIDLSHFEEEMGQVNNPSWEDINRRSNSAKIIPVASPMEFLALIANTHALARILFTQYSPLVKGLRELHDVLVAGKDRLKTVVEFQPSWFAHVLWKVYDACFAFFSKKLDEDDLLNGRDIGNPLENLTYQVSEFSRIERPGAPASLVQRPLANHPEEALQSDRPGKRKPGGTGGGKEPKKVKGGGEEDKDSGFRENKAFNATLKAAKQEVFNTVGKTTMGFVFKAAGQNTLKVLKALDLPTNRCARYMLWGGCGEKNCKNVHDDAALSKSQIAKANAFITEGCKKLNSEQSQME